ncbi:MAG: hypothetical protein H6Q43_2752 [Deltaproteobacteria bacterium]|jgi:hypothetical protein|nr:hypothetical protein [Deltaproteobacteria bacterium]
MAGLYHDALTHSLGIHDMAGEAVINNLDTGVNHIIILCRSRALKARGPIREECARRRHLDDTWFRPKINRKGARKNP